MLVSTEKAKTDTPTKRHPNDPVDQFVTSGRIIIIMSLPDFHLISSCLPFAEKACGFLTDSPDPYHAVANLVAKLEMAGFESLCDGAFQIHIKVGGKYYYVVDNTALVAFCVGPNYRPGEGGFKMICGHTDSPNLRVKPKSKRPNGNTGLIQIGVEAYVSFFLILTSSF